MNCAIVVRCLKTCCFMRIQYRTRFKVSALKLGLLSVYLITRIASANGQIYIQFYRPGAIRIDDPFKPNAFGYPSKQVDDSLYSFPGNSLTTPHSTFIQIDSITHVGSTCDGISALSKHINGDTIEFARNRSDDKFPSFYVQDRKSVV